MCVMHRPADSFTDRARLTTAAYGDSANLAARQAIYRYAEQPVDLYDWALEQTGWRDDARVIDVGCGNGHYLRRLAERLAAPSLVGIDLSRGMLADLVRSWDRTLPPPHLLQGDVQALPLADTCCDTALAMHMLYHVPDIERAVGELRRVLRPGGVLLVATNSERDKNELADAVARAIEVVTGVRAPSPLRADRRFSLETGASYLERSFAHVEPRELAGALTIPEIDPLVRYVQSTRASIESALPAGASWDAIIAEFERTVTDVISSEGLFRITTCVGLFVCR